MNGLKTDTIINRDALYALRELPEESVHCCVTSPPYYALRDYGLDMQIGREDTPEQYIDRLTEVFRELRRVLRSDGTLWLNIADTYCGTGNKGYHADPKNPKGRNGQQIARNNRVSGCKQKDLIGIPWLLAFPIRFSASGSGLRCFPPTGCSMRSFTRQGIRRNVPSAARSLRQPLTVSNTAPSAGSVSPADKPPSA